MTDLSRHLKRLLGVDPIGITPVRGGDVAEAFRVTLSDGRSVFSKTHASAPPGFFTTEARGLEWLRGAEAVPIPTVLAVCDDPAILVLEWIDEGQPSGDGDERFGRALEAMHSTGAPCFGREDRRSTGSRGLPNEPSYEWADFYRANRLLPLARLATDSDALPTSTIAEIERVAARLAILGGPPESAARLHGDLWAGNRLVGASGESWLIDPAAHGGHREFDLAMMRLFGGFERQCFAAYQEAAPLADGWEERVPLHQLAPLMVHAIKFGGHYVQATKAALSTLV